MPTRIAARRDQRLQGTERDQRLAGE
jgi:hypothetical protein